MNIRLGFSTVLAAVLLITGQSIFAQTREETLADIRQELSFLFVEMQQLKQELSTTGAANGVSGDTVLQRLDALEGELRRITGKTEELEFRVNNIVRDGTNRIGDLEFRLVELEGGDVSSLGETSTLGGDATLVTPTVVITPTEDGTALAVNEEVDFDNAKAAYDGGDLEGSASLFTGFIEDYPGGPRTADAQYWRGESLAGLGEWSSAARAFLQSFSSGPDNELAPQALYRLGVSLDKIGQTEEACLTLNEVSVRYPGVDAAARAEGTMANLGCAG
jgi:tol-pal system protein YbgF